MTDEQFIEWLRKISEYCNGKQCSYCKFTLNDSHICQFKTLVDVLNGCLPYRWNMEVIERIIKL